MVLLLSLSVLSVLLVSGVEAVPDAPVITPKPDLVPRQADPALLGWVSASNGQFSDLRSCDYPATLSSSGSLAQCCAASACTFWQSCSGGALYADKTSLRCDQGFCNTAILVPTVGASGGGGQSYLGCWATSLGQSPFTIVKDIGSAQVRSSTSSKNGGASNAPTSSTDSRASTQTATGSSQSNAAAAAAPADAAKPLTGVLALLALFMEWV